MSSRSEDFLLSFERFVWAGLSDGLALVDIRGQASIVNFGGSPVGSLYECSLMQMFAWLTSPIR